MRIDAVIFDLDGLLLDTERVAREAWARTADEAGVPISDDLVRAMTGLRVPDIRGLLAGHLASEAEANALMERSRVHYRAILDAGPVDVKRGAHALIDALEELDLPRAIATSSLREHFGHKTRGSGLPERVHAVVCGDEVRHGKPAPDIYLAAASALGLAPGACLAFEDSGPGIESATSAGMRAILVPDHHEPTVQTRQLAAAEFSDLEAAIPYVLRAARR